MLIVQCVRILVAAGADVYSTGPHGETLLAECVHSGNMELVHHLIDSGYIVQYAPDNQTGNTSDQQTGSRQYASNWSANK